MTPTRTRRPRPAPEPAEPTGRPFPPPTDTSEALVEANLGLARQAAWRWSRKTGQPYDDLEAIAFVGLIRGCRRYDPDRINPANGKPYALSTIVCPYITGEILHWFRDHGHAIKYPSRWREQWGKVQRLLAEDLPPHQIAAQVGMTIDELAEMAGSMTGTTSLDQLQGADRTPALEPDELDRLQPLQALVDQAWANLHPGDARALLTWWAKPHRQALPQGPLQQFHTRLKALLRGRRLSEVLQMALPLSVPEVEPAPKDKPRRRRRISKPVDQLGLLSES